MSRRRVQGPNARLATRAQEKRTNASDGRPPARAPARAAIEALRFLAHESRTMTSSLAPSLRSLAVLAALAAPLAPARALVGAAPDGRFADRVAMVLIRGGDEAGFCSALVLSPRILLTAAHCLRPLRDMAVHYRDPSGAAVIIPVDNAVAHPLYRPDAIQARVESIDLALIRTTRALDPPFVSAAIAAGEPPAIGAAAIVSGYGAAREPASKVLIWAADPAGREAGACNGDSGAPIWSADGSTAIAIVAWAQAPRGHGCGGLTQGPLLAPLRGWIEETERRLSSAR